MMTALHGAGDRLVSFDNLDHLERKLGADLGSEPGHKLTYQLIREEGRGHFLTWERPNLVRQAILQQLTALEEKRSRLRSSIRTKNRYNLVDALRVLASTSI